MGRITVAAIVVAVSFLSARAEYLSDPVFFDLPVDGGDITTDATGAFHVVAIGGLDEMAYYVHGTSLESLSEPLQIPGSSGAYNPRIDVSPDGTVHIAYQVGRLSGAKSSYYVSIATDGTILTPEKFADANELYPDERAYVPDVAADSKGNVLASAWIHESKGMYRWRSPGGAWGDVHEVGGYHPSPKVEERNGKFYFYWLKRGDAEWAISGPVAPGGSFSSYQDAGGKSSGLTIHNEGGNFSVGSDGTITTSGSARVAFEGPCAIWVGCNESGSFTSHTFAGMSGTTRGDESHFYPGIVIDEATGDHYVVCANPADKRAYYACRHNGTWTSLKRLLPEHEATQVALRNGPTVADIAGPGVVVFTWAGRKPFLRMIYPDGYTPTQVHPRNTAPRGARESRTASFHVVTHGLSGLDAVLPTGLAYQTNGRCIVFPRNRLTENRAGAPVVLKLPQWTGQ